MIDKELLKILRCPETRQVVHYLEGEIFSKINAAISSGTLENRGHQTLQGPIEAGLLREDRKFLYPIVGGIPNMLIDEAIPFAEFDHQSINKG